jgi:hypothetical protein
MSDRAEDSERLLQQGPAENVTKNLPLSFQSLHRFIGAVIQMGYPGS